jgi:hypothetical protein
MYEVEEYALALTGVWMAYRPGTEQLCNARLRVLNLSRWLINA